MTETAQTAEAPTRYVQSPGGIAELTAQIRSGDITPAQLVQRYLDRITECDAAVEAWLSVDSDGAMAMINCLGRRTP